MSQPASKSGASSTRPALLHEPFRGIDSYRYADQPIFFGREDEAEELAGMIRRYRGVLLYGVSGCGKTSIINAKLTPDLSERGWVVERLRVQPVRGQEIVLRRDDGEGNLLPSRIASTDQENEAFSAEELVKRLEKPGQDGRCLLIFDQFEELVTLFDLAPETIGEREAALKLQAGILDVLFYLLREAAGLPVKLLFAFREDYLARLQILIERVPELSLQSVHLKPLLPDKLPEVITGPFQSGISYDRPAFSDTLVGKLAAAFGESARGGPVNLTELQIVCLSLYRSDHAESELDAKGIKGVMEDYLEKALTGEPPEIRRAATTLLTRLLTPANTRNVVSREDLISQAVETRVPREVVEAALERLVSKLRLVREELRGDTRLCEIISEFLVPWIRKQRQKRRQEGENRRNYAIFTIGALCIAVCFGLYQWQRGQTAVIAGKNEEIANQYKILEEKDQAIQALQASMADTVRQKERVIGELSKEKAQLTALLENMQSDNTQLTALLQEVQDELVGMKNTWQSGRLSLDVKRTNALPPYRQLSAQAIQNSIQATQQQIQSVLETKADSQNPVQAVLGGHAQGVQQAAFSPDGSLVALAGADGRLSVWTSTGRVEFQERLAFATSPDGADAALNTVAFSPDGSLVFAGGGFTGKAAVLSLPDKKVENFQAHQGAVTRFVFSPDGKLGASTGADGVSLWGPDAKAGWRQPKRLRHWTMGKANTASQNVLTGAVFAPKGDLLAVGGDGHLAGVWSTRPPYSADDGFPGGNPANCRAPVRRLVFSPDGKTVAAGAGMKVLLWREGASMLRLLDKGNARDEHIGAVWQVAFKPDDPGLLASIGADGRCVLWDVRDAASPKAVGSVPTQIRGRLFAMAWQGDLLALGGEDGWLEIWDMKDAASPRKHFSTSAHSGPVWGLVFDRSGKTLLSHSGMVNDPKALPSAKGEAARWAGLLSLTPGENVMLWNMEVIRAMTDGWREKQEAKGSP